MFEHLHALAEKYPQGISALPELPEECSGAVYQSNPSVFQNLQAQEATA